MATHITRQQAIQALIESDKVCVTAEDIGPIIGTDPQTIRDTARQRPELLKFEFFISGSRVKIPRIPFLRYIGINVNENGPEAGKEKNNASDHEHMSNEELLLAITHELNTFKQEINQRLDKIESQSEDLNNVLQSARRFLIALSGLDIER